MINIMILIYMTLNLIIMFTPGEGDFLSTIVENIIVDDVGKVKLEDTALSQFVAIRKQGDRGKRLKLDDRFKDHLDVSFSFYTADWYKPETAGRFT